MDIGRDSGSPPGPCAGRAHALLTATVRDVAIEIDLREAVSRFLNVCAKSGGQSVDFYFPRRAKSGNSADDVQTNIVLLANTFLAPDDSACVRVGHAWPSIRIFAYVIMMFLARYAARTQTRESALALSTRVIRTVRLCLK